MYTEIETYKYRMLHREGSKLDYEILELIKKANKKPIAPKKKSNAKKQLKTK